MALVAGKGAASPKRRCVCFNRTAGHRSAAAVAIGTGTGAKGVLGAFRQEIIQDS